MLSFLTTWILNLLKTIFLKLKLLIIDKAIEKQEGQTNEKVKKAEDDFNKLMDLLDAYDREFNGSNVRPSTDEVPGDGSKPTSGDK